MTPSPKNSQMPPSASPHDDFTYDLLVIGSGPGGQRAAIQAAKLGKKVAVVERKAVVGGVCINTGTIPSKTFREAIMHLSGYNERGLYGSSYAVKDDITVQDLLLSTDQRDVARTRRGAQPASPQPHREHQRRGLVHGAAYRRLRDVRGHGDGWRDVTARHIVIGVGTKAARDPKIPFDGQRIIISDDILDLRELPRTVTVIGGGRHRLRVRQHVRRARRARDPDRQAPATAGIRGPRDHRRAGLPDAPEPDDPAAGRGGQGGGAVRGPAGAAREGDAGQRQGDRQRHGAVRASAGSGPPTGSTWKRRA